MSFQYYGQLTLICHSTHICLQTTMKCVDAISYCKLLAARAFLASSRKDRELRAVQLHGRYLRRKEDSVDT